MNSALVIEQVMRIILRILFIILLATPVAACKCDISLSTSANIESVSYVALVKVKNILSINSKDYYKIVVEELILYKGSSTSEILVAGGNPAVDPNSWTSCDLGIEINDEWLIYGNELDGKIHTSLCSHSFPYKDKNGYRDLMGAYKIKTLNEINTYFKKPLIDYSINKGMLKLYYPNGQEECEIKFKKGKNREKQNIISRTAL